MGRVVGWMRPAVHINDSLLRHPRQQHVIRDDFLRGPVHLLPDPHLRLTARLIIVADGPALIFRQRQQGGIPAIGAQTGRGIDRQPQVVTEIRSSRSLRLIFVEPR